MSIFDYQHVIEKFSYVFCMFIFSLRICLSAGRICQYLDPNDPRELFSAELINIFISIMLTILISVSFYHNFRFRNHLFQVADLNNKLLFFIFVPTGIYSAASKTITGVAYIAGGSGIAGSIINLVVTLTIFLLMSVYITYININRDDGEVWRLNFFNIFAILLALIFFAGDSLLMLSREQVNAYKQHVHYTVKNHSNVRPTALIETANFLNSYFLKFGFLCELISSVLLLEPLKRHFLLLEKTNEQVSKSSEEVYSRRPLSIVTVCLSLFSVGSTLSLVVSNKLLEAPPLEIMIFVVIANIVAIFNVYFIVTDVGNCPKRNFQSGIYSLFLFLGLFGQSIVSLTVLHYSARESLQFPILQIHFLSIAHHILQIIQCHFQTVLILMTLENQRITKRHDVFYGFVYDNRLLIAYNVGLLIADISSLKVNAQSIKIQAFYVRVFVNNQIKIGCTFAILNRIVSITVLANYFKF